ncbi:MAG: serine hydrolase [Thermoplasmatales archaeon]|nr:serine hydrolase [Thermoplasmatales archaeon]
MKKIIISLLILCLILSTIPITIGIEEGIENEAADDFDARIEELMRYGHLPSIAVCIVKNNTTVWAKGYGYADLNPLDKRKATPDTVYPIGSTSKSVCAVAIMQLNESGLIGLDDNVSEYLPFDLKNPKYPKVNITIRMLMAHQSSIPDTTLRFLLYFTVLKLPYSLLDDYFLPGGSFYSSKVWNDYAPGEDVCYSTQNNEILSYALQQITNQSYADYCQENIFEPLQMYNTSFYFSDYDKDELAGLYLWVRGVYLPMPYLEPTYHAAGGVKTTISDFSHFLIMHTSGGIYDGVRILSEESVEEMHSAQYPDSLDEGHNHGFGWYFKEYDDGEIYGGHGGRHHGAGAELRMRYSDKVGILFFWNQFAFFRSIILKNPLPEESEARREIMKALFEKADEL